MAMCGHQGWDSHPIQVLVWLWAEVPHESSFAGAKGCAIIARAKLEVVALLPESQTPSPVCALPAVSYSAGVMLLGAPSLKTLGLCLVLPLEPHFGCSTKFCSALKKDTRTLHVGRGSSWERGCLCARRGDGLVPARKSILNACCLPFFGPWPRNKRQITFFKGKEGNVEVILATAGVRESCPLEMLAQMVLSPYLQMRTTSELKPNT